MLTGTKMTSCSIIQINCSTQLSSHFCSVPKLLQMPAANTAACQCRPHFSVRDYRVKYSGQAPSITQVKSHRHTCLNKQPLTSCMDILLPFKRSCKCSQNSVLILYRQEIGNDPAVRKLNKNSTIYPLLTDHFVFDMKTR